VYTFEQLSLNMQAQSVRMGVDAQLLLVSSPRCFEVVADSGRFVTTTSCVVAAMLARRLSSQMLLTLA
jgi:hypothetical protein